MYNNNCQCISDELHMDPDEIQSPKADLGYPWVIIYEHRAIVCAYVYDFSLNKQTNKTIKKWKGYNLGWAILEKCIIFLIY